ncbi:hypothetical protein TcasGA2_TC034913 [Tribolium castaneum]|uniref:Uncharacterized protein n=1 Tax=Tribolium castaneum TaxID=7070 RepID=A0A139WAI3_TRICA|nr:hypothetical protein TcasGA2_TC034913 [Tribolium castaneum]
MRLHKRPYSGGLQEQNGENKPLTGRQTTEMVSLLAMC